jgi:hypothetical protein
MNEASAVGPLGYPEESKSSKSPTSSAFHTTEENTLSPPDASNAPLALEDLIHPEFLHGPQMSSLETKLGSIIQVDELEPNNISFFFFFFFLVERVSFLRSR